MTLTTFLDAIVDFATALVPDWQTLLVGVVVIAVAIGLLMALLMRKR